MKFHNQYCSIFIFQKRESVFSCMLLWAHLWRSASEGQRTISEVDCHFLLHLRPSLGIVLSCMYQAGPCLLGILFPFLSHGRSAGTTAFVITCSALHEFWCLNSDSMTSSITTEPSPPLQEHFYKQHNSSF